VAVNEITKKELIAAGIGDEEKFTVIYPGFKALKQHSKIDARRRLGLIDDVFTVGFIGRFESIKRPDILSNLINISLRGSESTQFIVCGGGELYEGFKDETTNPKVHYFSWTDDLSQIYSSVDLMLLTSDNEGSPLTIIEAGQLGVPTLSRAVGGVPSLISHESTGFLTTDDPEAIASALSRISKSPDLLLEVSTKTKEHFGHSFGELNFLNSYKSLYIKAGSN
jgi:glycosyltransferase involved in cell wall biosynthesis